MATCLYWWMTFSQQQTVRPSYVVCWCGRRVKGAWQEKRWGNGERCGVGGVWEEGWRLMWEEAELGHHVGTCTDPSNSQKRWFSDQQKWVSFWWYSSLSHGLFTSQPYTCLETGHALFEWLPGLMFWAMPGAMCWCWTGGVLLELGTRMYGRMFCDSPLRHKMLLA